MTVITSLVDGTKIEGNDKEGTRRRGVVHFNNGKECKKLRSRRHVTGNPKCEKNKKEKEVRQGD